MNTFESEALPDRLRGLAVQLERGLVERRVVVRRCLLTALAGEHTLLIGPPGTAKSELARRLRAAFRDARYFERLLTRFTVPEELFGPLSIRALEQDRYERHTAGFLPDASIAFIDEVFKANSAILNALLTLLNEREFDNGAGRQHCPLVSVIGATNDVPEDEVGEAFFDRFLTRLPVAPVSTEGFAALLDTGCTDPWSLADDALALADADLATLGAAAREVALPAGVVAVLSALRMHLAVEGGYVSDRRWVKTLWLLRVAAASEGRNTLLVWKERGVARIEQENRTKAELLYRIVDGAPEFFRCPVERASRSMMNVVFRLPTEELEQTFLKEAKAARMVGLKGHRSVGGLRASLYNAVEPAWVRSRRQCPASSSSGNSA